MPHFLLESCKNPSLVHRYGNNSLRYNMRTTMLSLCTMVNSLCFQLQDKHNASSFSVCLGKSCLNPNTKVENFCDNLLSYNVFFVPWVVFRMHSILSILYPALWLQFPFPFFIHLLCLTIAQVGYHSFIYSGVFS